MDLRWGILVGYGPLFVSGLWTTVQLTIVAIGAGLLLGVLLGLVSSSRDAPQPKSTLLAWALKAARGVTLAAIFDWSLASFLIALVIVTAVLRGMAQRLDGSVPLVGVGGILSGADAVAKFDAGAALVQCYTGLVYRGPALIGECVEALRAHRAGG